MPKTKKKQITKPKKFRRITVTVEPTSNYDGCVELRTEITLDKNIVGYRELVEQNHFNSLFDYVWNKIKLELDSLLKKD